LAAEQFMTQQAQAGRTEFYENYFDWRKRNDRRTGSKALAGAGHEIVKVGHKSGDFKSRSRTAKVSEAFIKPSARLMPWPLQQAKSHLLRFRNSPLKMAVFVGKQTHGSDQSGSGGDPVRSKKEDPSLWVRHLNDDPIFAGVAASNRLGRVGSFCSGCRNRASEGDCVSRGESHDAKRIRISICQFFAGIIPIEGWKVGQAYKRAILGAQTGRVYKVE